LRRPGEKSVATARGSDLPPLRLEKIHYISNNTRPKTIAIHT
jgi:hypothetical protein